MSISFFNTYINPEAFNKVKDVLDSTFLSEGNIVKDFENELHNKLGLINPVAVNSCTSALHLALILAGVREDDEVILTAQTFIATGMVILMQKAKPVFADIQYNTGNIDPISIKEKITSKTKAIIAVHWGGYPCDIDEINKIARENNLKVIEDAAHAIGAVYKNKPIGSISDFTCFSFQAIKHLTTGDGGAICCKNDEDYLHAKRLRWFGIDRLNSKPSILGEREFDVSEIGYKYHLNNFSASLGIANLADIDKILERRLQISDIYRKELKNIKGIQLLNYQNDRKSAWWLFTLLVDNRLNFITKLKEKNIPASVVHLRIDSNTVFGGIRKELVNQARFNNLQVSLPVHSDLKEEDINHIIETIKHGW
jgi:perosamine synthetase